MMAVRTDPLLRTCTGDSLHLSEPYKSQNILIGPDYCVDLVTMSKRKGWKESFSRENRK